MLLGPVALVPTSCNCCCSWYYNNFSKSLPLIGVSWWISHSNCPIAICRWASDHIVAACRELLRRTWYCVRFVVVIFSALSTWTSIAVRILAIFCTRNWWDSFANWSSTIAIAEFDIFCFRKAPCFLYNWFSAWSSAVRDWWEWFCWLTSRDNSYDPRIAPVTIPSEVVCATDLPLPFKQKRIGAQFTAIVQIIPRISIACQELLLTESNSPEKHWRLRNLGTYVNQMLDWSFTFLAFWYWSSQCNQPLSKLNSSWCNSSGCQRR